MLTDEEALRFVYKEFKKVLTSFPSALDDVIRPLPPGYKTVWELIEQADREAEAHGLDDSSGV